jgi:alpha-glucosidase
MRSHAPGGACSTLQRSITETLALHEAVGATPSWVWSNHDVIRHATRLAWADVDPSPQLGTRVPAPNPELGLRRARAATALLLALPGSAYLYQGEELGLPEVFELPPEARQDPAFFRTGGAELGRDGCRVPLPWRADAPAFGFSQSGAAWLPQPAVRPDTAVWLAPATGVAGRER